MCVEDQVRPAALLMLTAIPEGELGREGRGHIVEALVMSLRGGARARGEGPQSRGSSDVTKGRSYRERGGATE